jgi:alkanesulfonate monooxygenase SsuD/methylene tetrahydromethanopterin reductase-like flavin-dependent oxidoreductase (luciferase family)
MRIGVGLPMEDVDGVGYPYRDIRQMALRSEEVGFDSLWTYDHLLFRDGGETTGLHECWTIMTAIAEATTRVQLGTLVLCTEFRNAALLAKMAGTLDHVSDGRLILGIGCGWNDPEYEAFGYPTDHKVGRFEDSVTIIHALLREGRADHVGRFHSVRDAELVPRARPDLPILIAAKRPRMLDLTATYADAWNLAWFGMPNERLSDARADLEVACARVGRDPASIEITVGVEIRFPEVATSPPEGSGLSATPLNGEPDEIAEAFRTYEAWGADHLIIALDPATPAALETLIEGMRRYRGQETRDAQLA